MELISRYIRKAGSLSKIQNQQVRRQGGLSMFGGRQGRPQDGLTLGTLESTIRISKGKADS